MTSASTATNAAPLHATVELHATGRGTLRMSGKVRPIVAPDIDTARHNVIDLVAQRAQEHGAPVILHATDPDGDFAVTVSVDGTVTESVDAPAPPPDDNSHTAATHQRHRRRLRQLTPLPRSPRRVTAPDTAGNHERPVSDVGRHTARHRSTHRSWPPARSGAPHAADTAAEGV